MNQLPDSSAPHTQADSCWDILGKARLEAWENKTRDRPMFAHVLIPFGVQKGKPITDVSEACLRWVLANLRPRDRLVEPIRDELVRRHQFARAGDAADV